MNLTAVDRRQACRVVAGGQHTALLQFDAAAAAIGPRGGRSHAFGSKIDFTGGNDAAAIDGMERVARRVARLDGFGGGVVTRRWRLLIAVRDDLLCNDRRDRRNERSG
nr:hypothetical protein [Stenotrophomonas maltophilia]